MENGQPRTDKHGAAMEHLHARKPIARVTRRGEEAGTHIILTLEIGRHLTK